MTVDTWLAAVTADADRRGLADLKPLLETMAKSTAALRNADDAAREPAVRERAAADAPRESR